MQEWCIRMANLSFPVSITMLRSIAVNILQDRLHGPGITISVGSHWHSGFLKCHPAIKLCYIQYLEKQR